MNTPEEHKQRHAELHAALDELVADWLTQTGQYPSKATVFEVMKWSHKQTLDPDHPVGVEVPDKNSSEIVVDNSPAAGV